ncbi:MAG TPA: ATP-binding protein [Gallicola sp.]|nr:ATP-binding protein [Gallicola sp.]
MKPINLYFIYKILENNNISNSNKILRIIQKNSYSKLRKQEFLGIDQLIDNTYNDGFNLDSYENYFVGYKIPQISKEFDLLKISDESVINIELKSKFDETKIKRQLLQNKYYLESIGKTIFQFTIILEENKVYKMQDDDLMESDYKELFDVMKKINNKDIDINKLFDPSKYLVSPLNNPEKFIKGQYFLTDIQENISKNIIGKIRKNKNNYFSIQGRPGTGKTLLALDIAKKLSEIKKVCFIHMGTLVEGHHIINDKTDIDVIAIKQIRSLDISKYEVFIFDESQRMFGREWIYINENIFNDSRVFIFSLDPDQTMSVTENKSDTASKIFKIPNILKSKLTEKVRSNPEITDFVLSVLDQSKKNKIKNSSLIDIISSSSTKQTKYMIELLEKKGYKYIQYTPSQYNYGSMDNIPSELNSHRVIGQDINKVVVVMNKDYYYNNKILHAKTHPNPDYLFVKLFYQAATRAQSNLTIIIENNDALLKKLLELIN